MLVDRRNLDFLLFDWLAVAELTGRPRFSDHDCGTFGEAIDLAERLGAEYFLPHRRASDLAEPRVEHGRVVCHPAVSDALAHLRLSGLMAAAHDYQHGGMQMPATVNAACHLVLMAANLPTFGYALLTAAAANLLRAHGTEAQQRRYMLPMLQGHFTGTMCLSEPHAGSSLAEIKTRAAPAGDGGYTISGNKMWISGGDHELAENIIHLVLARLPDAPPGAKGISLFIVPKARIDEDGSVGRGNGVELVGINKKMGFRGLVNCALHFDEARAELVGKPGTGLPQMFHMMDEARLDVGMNSAALAHHAYLQAVNYARERRQGRLADTAASEPQVPIIAHGDVRRMLLAQRASTEGSLALILYAQRLVDDIATGTMTQAKEAKMLLGILTPLVKAYVSDICLRANDLAIQVHGGAGYTRDFDAEMLYRDNRLNPIHEGTNGVHANDLVGRQLLLDSGGRVALLLARMQATVVRAASIGRFEGLSGRLAETARRVAQATGVLAREASSDRALAHAYPFLEALGATVLGWMWLEQAVTAFERCNEDPAFVAEKRAAAEYWFAWELTRATATLDALQDLNAPWFELESRSF